MQFAVLRHAVTDIPDEAGRRPDAVRQWYGRPCFDRPALDGPRGCRQRPRESRRGGDRPGEPGALAITGDTQEGAGREPEPAPDHRRPPAARATVGRATGARVTGARVMGAVIAARLDAARLPVSEPP